MSELTSEAYNKFGFTVEYYIKKISTKRDRIFGEDALENIVRRFKLSVYTDNVPQMQKMYQLQGMYYQDIVHVQCTVQHFKEASVRSYLDNSIAYDEYYPRVGDLMYFPWNKTFYEIINVKNFTEGSTFLSTPITFEFILKVWKPNHEDVDVMDQNPDPMQEVDHYASLGEALDIDTTPANKHQEQPSVTVTADFVDPVTQRPFSTSGDVLSINNSLNGLDKTDTKKSINDPIYRSSKLTDTIFDPFEN